MDSTLDMERILFITANRDMLVNALRQVLRENAFSNRLLLAPRRLQEIGQHEAEAFLQYLDTVDPGSVQERGRRLALQGLGPRAVLAMTITLRRTILHLAEASGEAWSVFLETADSYIATLMEGYMMGLEEYLRQEVERTQQAYTRSVEKQFLQG